MLSKLAKVVTRSAQSHARMADCVPLSLLRITGKHKACSMRAMLCLVVLIYLFRFYLFAIKSLTL